MNNIINLVKKEFLTIDFLHPRYLFLTIMAIAYSIFIPRFITLSYYMLTMIIIISSFYIDELSKGNIVPISLVTSPSLISEYTEQEKKLIIEFRMLSPEAQSSVCDFIKFKLASESTKKSPKKIT